MVCAMPTACSVCIYTTNDLNTCWLDTAAVDTGLAFMHLFVMASATGFLPDSRSCPPAAPCSLASPRAV